MESNVNQKVSKSIFHTKLKLKVLWDKTYDYYWKNLGRRFREFSRNIKNLIRWFPVIWKDRDWDHHFIWEILKFKLKNQSKYIGGRDIHTSAKYDAQRMMLCVRLIDKIQEEYYSMEYIDYQRFDEYFNQHKAAVRKVLANKEHQIFELTEADYKKRLAMNLSYYNEKRAQDILFRLLNRDIKGWWD